MIDLNRIRTETEAVQAALGKRGVEVDFGPMLQQDKARREAIGQTEALKARRNELSGQVPRIKKEGGDPAPLFAQVRAIGEEIKALDAKVAALDAAVKEQLYALPNLPDDDVVAGGKEQNAVLRQWGEKPADAPRNHVELAESLGLIDYARGAKLSGNGYWLYTGVGAQLEWALLNYFVQSHLQDGYRFMLVPHMLGEACGFTAGQFPKFRDEVYRVDEGEMFMLPTAETALVNLHRDEILPEDLFPLKYFSYTPCYRKEAGSYRAEERGMIRGHQFNKVEMVQYALPERSGESFEELVDKAERLVRGLGLHYRVSKLAAGDVSASMARTYDIEVWIPSMGIYKEVSSVSNANDYQARRGNIRVRRKDSKKLEFAHTLNGSGLATSRILPTILEQYQQPDGSVVVPEVLRPYIGLDRIERQA